jgi:hypothetical protein
MAGLAVLGLIWLAGCGGGGGGPGKQPTAGAGTIQGSVQLAGQDPQNLQVMVDGVQTDATVGADGRFVVRGVRPGRHRVQVISRDGLTAGDAEVDVDPDEPADTGPIQLYRAGRITGMVFKEEQGQRTPLAGVEVVAQGEVPIVMQGSSAAPEPLIYPPPDFKGPTYSAFTDQDGVYDMRGVNPGPYLVAVVVPGLEAGEAYVWVEPGQTTVADFVLRPAIEPGVGTVQGTVRGESPASAPAQAGSPIPLEGAEVVVRLGQPWKPPRPGPEPIPILRPGRPRAQQTENARPVPIGRWGIFRTLTDKEGHYSLNVPSGHGEMGVWKDGYQPEQRAVDILPNQVRVEDFLLKLLEGVILPE